MKLLDGFYLPRRGVERIQSNVPKQDVAKVVVATFVCKGYKPGSDGIEEAVRLASLNDSNIPRLLIDTRVMWHLEAWPIRLLRISRMHPENDPLHLAEILNGDKEFNSLALKLRQHPGITDIDIGFLPQPERDKLPSIGIRGRLYNHILDGHHRTILTVWNLGSTINCLTAYRKPALATNS